jgi:hypothetical protein
VEARHEAFAGRREIAASRTVRALSRAAITRMIQFIPLARTDA